MTPTIGTALGGGFRIAHRSWAAMGLYAALSGGWLVGLVLIAVMTGYPKELLQPPPPSPLTPPPIERPAPTADINPDAVEAPGSAEATDPLAARREFDRRQAAAADQWLARAGLPVVLWILIAAIGGVWMYGGTVGYLQEQLTQGRAVLGTFRVMGSMAFWRLLGASVVMVLLVALGILAIGLLVVAGLFVLQNAPTWLVIAVAAVFWVGVFVAWVWLFVRLVFWFLAIVVDRLGPVASLGKSFRASRGRWWRLFGLWLVFLAIGLGVGVVFAGLDAVGNLMNAGIPMSIVTAILQIVVQTYLLFVSTAAYLVFYHQIKVAPAAPASPVPA